VERLRSQKRKRRRRRGIFDEPLRTRLMIRRSFNFRSGGRGKLYRGNGEKRGWEKQKEAKRSVGLEKHFS